MQLHQFPGNLYRILSGFSLLQSFSPSLVEAKCVFGAAYKQL